jgi:hypothetical protein
LRAHVRRRARELARRACPHGEVWDVAEWCRMWHFGAFLLAQTAGRRGGGGVRCSARVDTRCRGGKKAVSRRKSLSRMDLVRSEHAKIRGFARYMEVRRGTAGTGCLRRARRSVCGRSGASVFSYVGETPTDDIRAWTFGGRRRRDETAEDGEGGSGAGCRATAARRTDGPTSRASGGEARTAQWAAEGDGEEQPASWRLGGEQSRGSIQPVAGPLSGKRQPRPMHVLRTVGCHIAHPSSPIPSLRHWTKVQYPRNVQRLCSKQVVDEGNEGPLSREHRWGTGRCHI